MLKIYNKMETNKHALGVVIVRMMEYMVHLRVDEAWLKFEVYPIQDWESATTGKKGTSYIDKENQPCAIDIFEESKCLKQMEGSFCWRGVWEGRLYFTNNEYWGEDISELSELYNDHIIVWCKDFIKKRNPLYEYYD